MAAVEAFDRLLDDVGEVHGLDLELLARFDADEEQEVLDHAVQAVGLGDDVLQGLGLVIFFEQVAAVEEQQAVANDGRDRRAQLVRDQAEEL